MLRLRLWRFILSKSSVLSRVRTPYDFDTRDVDPGMGDFGPSMTKQAFADECDINHIMARYETTGVLDHVNFRAGQYGDFASVPEFHDAMNIVTKSEEMFAALDARTRERFGNKPSAMLEFLNDPANRDEAIALGLVARPPEPAAPLEVRLVEPDPSPQPDPAAPAA